MVTILLGPRLMLKATAGLLMSARVTAVALGISYSRSGSKATSWVLSSTAV